MPSDTRLMPANYLRNILLDGTKPFLYRGSVRSLLGIPDSGGGSEMAFPHSLPPVGFVYPNSQSVGESYISDYFPDKSVSPILAAQRADSENFEEIAAKGAQQFMLPQDQSEEAIHSIFQAKENGNGEARNMPEAVLRQEKRSIELSEMPEKPSVVLEPTILDIPGTTQRIQNFPALSLSEQNELSSKKTEEQFQTPLSPEDVRFSSVESLAPESSNISAFVEPPSMKREEKDRGAEERPYQRSASVLSSSPDTTRRELARQVIRPQIIKEDSASEGQKNELYSAPMIKTKHSSQRVTPRLDYDAANKSSQSADRIDQLRNAVHELATKQSSSAREQVRDEVPQQQVPLPPPVQQVVIIKQAASQEKIPHAFWERSHLSHIRIRILR